MSKQQKQQKCDRPAAPGIAADTWIASCQAEAFDITLAEYDCLATQAHVLMLQKQGIMSHDQARSALAALQEIESVCKEGQFRYMPGLGAQLTLEQMIVDRVGSEIGHRVHTGRSRNDQVMVAQKLYVRDQVLELISALIKLSGRLMARAKDHIETIMPGYTHMQPARPTTVAQWMAAYADMFFSDIERLQSAYQRNDTCPLGAADSHGTSWNLDRDWVADLLGFDAAIDIPLYAISSRGESDTDFLSAMSFVSLHLSKMAQDLLLFTTSEYGYVTLGSGQAERMGKLTGSSIMPQKRNPDVLELLRAQASDVYSRLFHALDILKGLPTGYNRDSRDTKDPIIRGISSLGPAIAQACDVVAHIEFDRDRMSSAIDSNHSMAPDLAEYISQEYGVPFRTVHQIVGRAVSEAIDAGLQVKDLTPEDLRLSAEQIDIELFISPEDLVRATDPKIAIQRRSNLGGACQERMSEWYVSRQEALRLLEEWHREKCNRVSFSRGKIQRMSDELISGQ